MSKILQYPLIYEKEKLIGRGGDQEWFLDRWPRLAGCGAVCATSIFTYYLTNFSYQKESYISLMDEMFEVFTPMPGRGFPFVYLFARRMKNLLKEKGFDYHYKIFRNPGIESGQKFVINQINNNHPLALLILHHQSLGLKEANWHWVTICGYSYRNDGKMLIHYLDSGKEKRVLSKVLFRKSKYNYLKLVSFGYFDK